MTNAVEADDSAGELLPRNRWGRFILAATWILIGSVAATPAAAAPLAERLTPEVMAVVYPKAERLGREEGKPPAIPVLKDNKPVAYIFSTLDVVAAPGYSIIPFDVIAAVGLDGKVTGAKVVFHREPYIMNDVIRSEKLDTFLARHDGFTLRGGYAGALTPDYVTAATVTARAMRNAILDSARIVLRARVPQPSVAVPTLDLEGFHLQTWDELLAQGSVLRRRISTAEVATLLEKTAGRGATPEVGYAPGDRPYIELFVALATPAGIGRNLFGGRDFDGYLQRMPRGGHAIAIASNGAYDFLGTKYYQSGAKFDRFRIVQEDRVYEFERPQFQRLGSRSGVGGIRGQEQAALFFVPPDSRFEPLKPWTLELLVHGTGPSGAATVAVPVTYRLPLQHILMPEAPPVPAWVEAWQDSRTNVIILGSALAVLTLILAFQGQLSRYRSVHRWVRNGFLLFVLVWLGWTAGAQLSIINVINYTMAPFRNLDLGFYLAEPLMVMVAAYTVVSLLLLGRGVFCGWLCPFGALQELLAQAARALRLPQWNPSDAWQSRLWMGKYVSAAVVMGLAFFSVDMATSAAEVEPFKTAITSQFTRAWPFIVYAVALLVAGLFTERAYCRFLCPLGGVLALLDRLHLLDLLKRRPECGNPCHLCERSCPVRAIKPSGKIVMAECFQCLDCQVEYYDDRRCPPLTWVRKGRTGGTAPAPLPVAARVAVAAK